MDQIATAPPRKRGRPKVESDESRRQKITIQAESLFMRQGFVRTTMDEVAACCRMSKQTLYRLFPSKLDLIVASVARHRLSMLAPPPADPDLPLDHALCEIFRIGIGPEEDQERLAFLSFIWREAAQIPELNEIIFSHGALPARDDLAAWLAVQVERGRLRLSDPTAGARILMDMIFGSILQKALGDHLWPGAEDRQAYIRQCVEIFLNGVAVKAS